LEKSGLLFDSESEICYKNELVHVNWKKRNQ